MEKLKVLILATPRTGSTYFAHSVGKLLNLSYIPEESFLSRSGFDIISKGAFRASKLPNDDIFVTKCMIHHYNFWFDHGYDIFEYFDIVCYLTRKDARVQAKSLAICTKTGIFNTKSKNSQWGSKYVMEDAGIKIPNVTEEEIDKIIEWNKKSIKLTSDYLGWDIEHAHHTYCFEDFIASDKPIAEFVSTLLLHSKRTASEKRTKG